MTIIFQILILASLWCYGVHVIVKEFLYYAFKWDIDLQWDQLEKTEKFIAKPLFACPYCTASFHGTIIYFWFLFGHYSWFGWVPFIVCLCGLNYLLSKFFVE